MLEQEEIQAQEPVEVSKDLDGFPEDGIIYCESGEELKKLRKYS